MLWLPPSVNDFRTRVDSAAGVRPAAAQGTSVAAAGSTHTMGSWVQLLSGASVTDDLYGLLININSAYTAATNRAALLDIGVDDAGGTSYRVVIPYLMAGNAADFNIGSGGLW